MKRKMIMALCVTACTGMLFGCGKKETAETVETATESVAEPETTEDSPVVPEQEEPEEEIEEPESTADDDKETADAAANEETLETEEKETGEYTLEEMLEEVEEAKTIYAIKRGDLFYGLKAEEKEYSSSGRKNYGSFNCEDNNSESLMVRAADETIWSLDYTEGDELVVFDVAGVSAYITPVIDASEHYCIPMVFSVGDAMRGLMWMPEYLIPDSSYAGGDRELQYFEEYGGTVVKRCLDGSEYYHFLLEGDRDEIIELGGYEGTQYKHIRCKCTGRYYTVSANDLHYFADDCEMTKEGYAIISNTELNTLEDGLYIIGGCMVEVKN